MTVEIVYNANNALVYVVRGWLPTQADLNTVDNPPPDVMSREEVWGQCERLPTKRYQWAYFGKTGPKPRSEYACGDDGIDYHDYARGKNKIPVEPWFDAALRCRDRIERESQIVFNAQLTNQYDDHTENLSAHADKELRSRNNEVVTISVGASRRLTFHSHTSVKVLFEVWLHDGDLLLMYGDVQKLFRHAIPEEKTECGKRYSLTYRLLKMSTLKVGPVIHNMATYVPPRLVIE